MFLTQLLTKLNSNANTFILPLTRLASGKQPIALCVAVLVVGLRVCGNEPVPFKVRSPLPWTISRNLINSNLSSAPAFVTSIPQNTYLEASLVKGRRQSRTILHHAKVHLCELW